MLAESARLMRSSLEDGRRRRSVYRRAGPPVPPLRRADPLPRAGRRRTGSPTGAPAAREERARPRRKGNAWPCAPRSSTSSLRCFCLAAFAVLPRIRCRRGDPVRVRGARDGRRHASLYEYRPLVRWLRRRRGHRRLAALADARIALDELGREPAAAIFAARARGQLGATGDEALLRTILLPLLADVAERCGGFDWQDDSFERAYAAFERRALRQRRAYAAIAPLTALSAARPLELAEGLCIRPAAVGRARRTLARGAPACCRPPSGASPTGSACSSWSGRSRRTRPRRTLRRDRRRRHCASPRDRRSVAAGPVLFERLDWRPLGIRPVLPIAATEPSGEATRLEAFARAARLRPARPAGRAPTRTADLAEALDRWELSLFADEPYRSEQLREALTALLGEADGSGRRRCARPCCSADRTRTGGAARAPAAPCARSRRAGRLPTRRARRSSRRSPTATAKPGRIARRGAARAASAAGWLLRRVALAAVDVTLSAHSRHTRVRN